MANMARFCCCAVDDESDVPCTDCDPGGAGNNPNPSTVTGVDGAAGCAGENGTFDFSSYNETSDRCTWEWNEGAGAITVLTYAKSAITVFGVDAACDVSLAAGEWCIGVALNIVASQWNEKTTGFSCSISTGKVSGTHTFDECFDSGCNGTVTVTVPA